MDCAGAPAPRVSTSCLTPITYRARSSGSLLKQREVVQRIEVYHLAFITAFVPGDHFTGNSNYHLIHVALDPYLPMFVPCRHGVVVACCGVSSKGCLIPIRHGLPFPFVRDCFTFTAPISVGGPWPCGNARNLTRYVQLPKASSVASAITGQGARATTAISAPESTSVHRSCGNQCQGVSISR